MNRLHIERLKQVVRVLRRVPDKKFDLAFYMKKSKTCGTIGCAAGWAAANPWFKRRGFKLNQPAIYSTCSYQDPVYRGKTKTDALQEFFGFATEEDVKASPFVSSNYSVERPRKRTVIKALEKLITKAEQSK